MPAVVPSEMWFLLPFPFLDICSSQIALPSHGQESSGATVVGPAAFFREPEGKESSNKQASAWKLTVITEPQRVT